MDTILDRARELKAALVDFVLDSEGELAAALESYAARKSQKSQQDYTQRDLIIDSFLTEGKVGDQTPIDLFIKNQPELPESDRQLLKSWQQSFIGLFAINQILPDGFELMNWLTAKNYTVKPNNIQTLEEMSRFKPGEILLTRVSPVTDTYWMFSGPCRQMGNLGKPKLAVAIGNFKENYRNHLYSDAPELLEEAWQSVEVYHQDFVDFFGSDEITMPGYQLSKKISEFQDFLTKKRLSDTGIDQNKSLDELAQEAGISEEEIKEIAEANGVDSKSVTEMFQGNGKSKMVMPKIELPEPLKKAEQLTALTHPRWGQMFLTNHEQLRTLLTTEDWQNIKGAEKLIKQYLEDPTINIFIWQRLAQEYPNQLEKILQTFLNRPEFQLERDLESLLLEFNKTKEPELPEIASVPIHLNDLFQEAIAEVHKSKPKAKNKKPLVKGFQR